MHVYIYVIVYYIHRSDIAVRDIALLVVAIRIWIDRHYKICHYKSIISGASLRFTDSVAFLEADTLNTARGRINDSQ